MLAARGLDSQIVSQLVESRAETTGGFELFEPKHWIVTLLDSSMILLHSIVQILIVAMQNLTTNDPTWCKRDACLSSSAAASALNYRLSDARNVELHVCLGVH